ncbi:MAG: glycerate dehydrogenase [Clostridiales bacterium]|nr:glycerate dehydrogenase [Clostridiales bacterium]
MKAAFLAAEEITLRRVFTDRQIEEVEEILKTKATVLECKDAPGGDEDFLFSTWGFPKIDVKKYPNLKCVFYGAGSVQLFGRNLLENNIRLFSAWKANAVPVAEFTFAQILLAVKGYFPSLAIAKKDRPKANRLINAHPGAYQTRVGILGLGAIGSLVAGRLKSTDLEVWAYDPFVKEERAKELGVSLHSLEEIFASCQVVTNHIANLPATVGILKREHFFSMPDYACFINTGRGAQLDENDLYDALKDNHTRFALLDVITDEKNFDKCVLNELDNCFITPHMAGTSGLETERMGQRMVDNLKLYLKGEKSEDEVTLKMLETMA